MVIQLRPESSSRASITVRSLGDANETSHDGARGEVMKENREA